MFSSFQASHIKLCCKIIRSTCCKILGQADRQNCIYKVTKDLSQSTWGIKHHWTGCRNWEWLFEGMEDSESSIRLTVFSLQVWLADLVHALTQKNHHKDSSGAQCVFLERRNIKSFHKEHSHQAIHVARMTEQQL